MNALNYGEAKTKQIELEAKVKVASMKLKGYARNDVGLTTDDIKASKEWQLDKANYDRLFNELRNFNASFTKVFKKEIREDRRRK